MTNKEIFLKKLLIPTIISSLFFALLLSLAIWQTQRSFWKKDLISTFNENIAKPAISLEDYQKDNLEYKEFVKVSSIGELINDKSILIIGRSAAGKMGYRHFIPFSPSYNNSEFVWLDMGFIANDYQQIPKYEGLQNIEALVRYSKEPNFVLPKNDATNNIWFYNDLALQNSKVEIDANEDYYLTNLANVYDKNKNKILFTFANNHIQYLMVWLSLALWVLFVYFYYCLKTIRKYKLQA